MFRKTLISTAVAVALSVCSLALFSLTGFPLWLSFLIMLILGFACVFAALSVHSPSAGGGDAAGNGARLDDTLPDLHSPTLSKGYEVYQRALRHMEEDKPFLDPKLNLASFSRGIYSNTVYVSKNINFYSGVNFRTFVNRYRINHAIMLMKADPGAKIEDIAAMSGFHNPVSFNMAFRLFEGKTPTAWLEEYTDSLKKR